ncbi:MAG: pseudouridine synthase [Pseudomonadota bacterium]|nr:pseudouridine synthase [Pseudomonadota bacterium]
MSEGVRLQKFLADSGWGSRRDMDALVASGEVRVNGTVAEPGQRVHAGDMIQSGNRRVRVEDLEPETPHILLYHKPEGEIVSRDDPEGRPSVFQQLPRIKGARWIAIGRLDFNTSGLLVFTTSGELANRVAHPSFEVEREYAVRVLGELSHEQMEQSTREIMLEDGPAWFQRIEDRGGEGANHWYQVVLREGRNREVRRMFEALGPTVSRLIRVRFGILALPPRLRRGQVIELQPPEVVRVLEWAGLRRPAAPRGEAGTRKSRRPAPRAR